MHKQQIQNKYFCVVKYTIYIYICFFLHISEDIFKHGHLRYNLSCGRHVAKAVTLELNKRSQSVIHILRTKISEKRKIFATLIFAIV